MTKDEALKLALEALESSRVFVTTREKIKHPEGTEWYDQAITAIKEALAQPEQEPVAWMYVNTDGECEQIEYGEPFDDPSTIPLYTTPPQRTWVGLTDEDISKISQRLGIDHDDSWTDLKQAIEAKLKDKNNP